MKPVQTFRSGSIGLSVWERTGSNGPFYEFTIARSFKNKEGKTAYSQSFREYDAGSLRVVIDEAVEHIRGKSSPHSAKSNDESREEESSKQDLEGL